MLGATTHSSPANIASVQSGLDDLDRLSVMLAKSREAAVAWWTAQTGNDFRRDDGTIVRVFFNAAFTHNGDSAKVLSEMRKFFPKIGVGDVITWCRNWSAWRTRLLRG
jgi:hypothetical protein